MPCLQLLSSKESLSALFAPVLAHLEMFPFPVVDKCGRRAKGAAALGAEEALLSCVHHHVDLLLLLASKRFRTEIALMRTRP
jgi:hypothetical protein